MRCRHCPGPGAQTVGSSSPEGALYWLVCTLPRLVCGWIIASKCSSVLLLFWTCPHICCCLLRRPQLIDARAAGVAAVVPVGLGELADLSSVRIYIPKDLRPPDARTLALKARHLRQNWHSHHTHRKQPVGSTAAQPCIGCRGDTDRQVGSTSYQRDPAMFINTVSCRRLGRWGGDIPRACRCSALRRTCPWTAPPSEKPRGGAL